MAETKTTLQQAGLTRGKAVLIGLLAVALLGVLYLQYGASDVGDTTSSLASKNRRRPRLPSAPASASQSTAADQHGDSGWHHALAELDAARWPQPKLSEVIAYDPFALPAAFPKPPRAIIDPQLAEGGDPSDAALQAQQLADAVEQMQRRLEELQQRGVHVIINLRDEYVALVGDRTIHVGDEINGFIVTAIEPDGVRVERKALE